MSNTALLNRLQAVQIADAAVAHGLQDAVLSPGARNTPLIMALHDIAAAGWPVRLHSVIDERAAAFFALGIARRTGRPVMLSCTSGSAGAHYLPAVVEASEGQVPLIIVTADRPEELQDCGAPQTMPQRDLFGGHTRFSAHLGTPSDDQDPNLVFRTVQEAMAAALGQAPGPVHINAMFRKPLWAPGLPLPQPTKLLDISPPIREPSPADIRTLIQRVEGVRGVIVVGPDPSERLGTDGLIRLAQCLGWPILADPVTTVRNHPGGPIIRHHDALLRGEAFKAQHPCAVVISLGGTPSSHPLAELIKRTPTIRIDGSGRRWDPWQSVEWTLAADLLPTVSALEASYGAPHSADWLNAWLAADRVASDAIGNLSDTEMWEGPICRDLMAALPQDALLRLASSMPIRDVDSFGTCAPQPISVSSNRGVNGIDGLIATSLGEAQTRKGPVAIYGGDLSILHDIGSLSTTPRPSQPVVLTVVDNRGGGIFSYLPMAAHDTAFEPWFITPHKTDIAAVAAAHGLPCWSPKTMAELRQAWSEAFETPGLSLVYIAVDRERSVALHFEAWRRIAQAVDESL